MSGPPPPGLVPVTAVVVAKRPIPGRVKTRLVAGGLFDDASAAALAAALLVCTVERLAKAGFPVVLAVAGDRGEGSPAGPPDPVIDGGRWPVVEQGDGDLGARLERVWRRLEGAGVAFFGADAPDVPAGALAAIPAAIARADVAVGPTSDGGYWTLAARRPQPAVLRRIDWGGPSVYDQTCRRAGEAGLRMLTLPGWHDVDRPDDVVALRRRLRARGDGGGENVDPALDRLAERLDELLGGRDGIESTSEAARHD